MVRSGKEVGEGRKGELEIRAQVGATSFAGLPSTTVRAVGECGAVLMRTVVCVFSG